MPALTANITTSQAMNGIPFVGPHVFLEQQRLAQQAGDTIFYKSATEAFRDAQRQNLLRLRSTVTHARLVPGFQINVPPLRLRPSEAELAPFRIYDAKNAEDADWSEESLVRRKGDEPVEDHIANAAYDRLVESLSFFLEDLGIDSIDAKGMMIKAAVHIGTLYNNAYYTGGTINLGDGDGIIFKDFANDLSVIAHELGHGIVDKLLGGLTYWSQSGALNESIADVLGISALHYVLGQESTVNASWLIGQAAMVPYIDDDGIEQHPALRSFKAPGTAYKDHPQIGSDSQPATMENYYEGTKDNHGVHINSGIPNHAFYLASTGIGGYSSQTVLPVWLEAAKNVDRNASFKEFAEATVNAARKLFPRNKKLEVAILDAWTTVRVLGIDAIEISPVHEIPEGEDADEILAIFGIDTQELVDLQKKVAVSAVANRPEVQNCKVGFIVGKDGKGSLACVLYADNSQNQIATEFENSFKDTPVYVLPSETIV